MGLLRCSAIHIAALLGALTREVEAFVPSPLTSGAVACPSIGTADRANRIFPGTIEEPGARCAACWSLRARADVEVEPASSTPVSLAGSGSSSEVDSYLGELNFCLDPKDSALSGMSITKAVNKATNQVVKKLLILNSPEDDAPAKKELDRIKLQFETEFSEYPDYGLAKDYLYCVSSLGESGCPNQEVLDALPEVYRIAFRRVAAVLSDFGCMVAPGVSGKVRPTDKDICLSILDYATTVDSKTKALNAVANRVVRTICVGDDEDLKRLSREMESRRRTVLEKWIGGGWEGSQEDMFYNMLVELVQGGLTDETPTLSGAYLNSYQRLVGIVVQEVGTRSMPSSDMVFKNFLSWETALRKNLTEPAWEANPSDLVGSWALDDTEWEGLLGEGIELRGLDDLVVSFKGDGSVVVPPSAGAGLRWRLEPGPTHLDTIYFEMTTKTTQLAPEAGPGGNTMLLLYTGYVDRGARIEARFSRRFIKMIGRLTTVVKGTERPSTRFAMRLVDRGETKRGSLT